MVGGPFLGAVSQFRAQIDLISTIALCGGSRGSQAVRVLAENRETGVGEVSMCVRRQLLHDARRTGALVPPLSRA